MLGIWALLGMWVWGHMAGVGGVGVRVVNAKQETGRGLMWALGVSLGAFLASKEV